MVEDVSPAVVQILTETGTGSGFVIDSDGLVVTNAHVVAGFRNVDVRISGGKTYRGEVLGVDDIADLALVNISSSRSFDPVTLGDSDTVAVGEDVVAMGFPLGDELGREPTITRGVISSKRRYGNIYLLQTDAAINPGNSGGPLLDRTGMVVGVNTFRRETTSEGRPVEGIGFAVAINEVKERLSSLSRGQDTRVNTPTPEATQHPGGKTAYIERVELWHDDDGFIETEEVLYEVRNFWISADFDDSYSTQISGWDVGLVFRDSGGGNLQYISVTDYGWYSHHIRVEGEDEERASGWVESWNLEIGDRNGLLLYVVEDRGWLFANSQFVTDLDVSGGSRAGDLSVGTGFFFLNEVEVESTVVRDILAVEQTVLFGPDSGKLTKDDTFIAAQRAGVDVSAGYASAEFRVPSDASTWSAGLMFRKSAEDDYLVFYISSHRRTHGW